MQLEGKIINFLGDSITEGVGTSGNEARFSNLIDKACRLGRANNYGISGTRFARQRQITNVMFDTNDFCKRCETMDKDADINVVFGGTNDFGHGDAPIGTFEDRTPDTFYGACHYIMRRLQELYPTATTVIVTPIHRGNENSLRGESKPADVLNLAGYVNIIKEVAEFYGLPVLDLWRIGGMQPDVPVIKEMYIPDALHPNDAGHRILADRIIGFLQSL